MIGFFPLFMNKQIFVEQILREQYKAVRSFSPTSISHVFADKLHFSRFAMGTWHRPGAWLAIDSLVKSKAQCFKEEFL